MRIVQANALDSLDDYRIVEAPIPTPGPGQVRIRVKACGVGYVEALTALGGYQVKPPLPNTPGGEVAGLVDAMGKGVSAVQLGDRVMTYVGGGFAEYALAAAAGLTPIPELASFEEAAIFRVNYQTAIHGLRDRAQVAPGERLLVFGAAGGVGVAAVQVGRALGAEVIAACSSPEKRAFALAHGAQAAIDTEADGWRDRLKALTSGKGIDVVYDPVCGPLFEAAFRSLTWRGRHLVVGFVGGPIPALPANLTLMKGAALVGVDIRQAGIFEAERMRANSAELLQWLADGRIRPPVGRVFPFEQFREALAFARTGTGLGKAVLSIS